MNARDFLFPGVILVLVLVVGIGLLLTNTGKPATIQFASSTSTDTTVLPPATSTNAAMPSTKQDAPVAPSAYGSVTLALGQVATFADSTSIRPMHILEDSRCPQGVECIQAGTVKISLTTSTGGKTVNQTLSIGQSARAGNDTVTLESVVPTKQEGGYPAASSYRFTFKVKHG